MKKISFLFLFLLFFFNTQAQTYTYAIVIKDGHVIDPKNNINGIMDVAINDGKIVKVAKGIDVKQARQVINAKGLYVTPGIIDIHTHNYYGTNLDQTYMNGPNGIAPDGFTFRTGVTTVVDAGSSGWRTFPEFKKNIIDRSQTRVLAFLNIVGEGMRGGVFENNIGDMNSRRTAAVAKENAKDIVGIKLAHFVGHDWTPTDRAVEAGTEANIPLMVDFGSARPALSLEELYMKHLRPGDIYTHAFGGGGSGREAIVDSATKKLRPFVLDAQKRGIIFDVGFGGSSFAFEHAIPALKSGFYPNSISTDQHITSMNNAMKDMLNIMSLFMAMGMDFNDVIKASTWNPAQEIKREELGNLSVGSEADVAVLKLQKGKFGFWDKEGYKIEGDSRLNCEATIRAGRVVYDLNGITHPVVLPRNTNNQRRANP